MESHVNGRKLFVAVFNAGFRACGLHPPLCPTRGYRTGLLRSCRCDSMPQTRRLLKSRTAPNVLRPNPFTPALPYCSHRRRLSISISSGTSLSSAIPHDLPIQKLRAYRQLRNVPGDVASSCCTLAVLLRPTRGTDPNRGGCAHGKPSDIFFRPAARRMNWRCPPFAAGSWRFPPRPPQIGICLRCHPARTHALPHHAARRSLPRRRRRSSRAALQPSDASIRA